MNNEKKSLLKSKLYAEISYIRGLMKNSIPQNQEPVDIRKGSLRPKFIFSIINIAQSSFNAGNYFS